MANVSLFARIFRNKMKILLVEDNAEMRRLLKSMVEKIADEIIEASDGAAAIELYHREHPDWVLMDIFMKPTDGLTAAGAIKNMDAEARIIFVSNHTDKRTREAAHDAGGTAFFSKGDLLSLVEFLMRQL